MKVIGIIPARYASTRFPGKPLAIVKGLPMIQQVCIRSSKVLSEVIVATDDQRIFDCVSGFGGNVVMTSGSHASGTDRCHEAYLRYLNQGGKHADVLVNIQGDEPFIHPDQLRELISCFELPETNIATLIRITNNAVEINDPNIPKVVVDKNFKALYFSRYPIPYIRDKQEVGLKWYKHIGLYAFRPSTLKEISELSPGMLEMAEKLEQLRWLENGFTIQTRLTEFNNLSVDTPDDLILANQYEEC
jgi:3-deoxy-manno-octulosonate cytidylyltransferase (CMP-KDO synthetase)